MLFLLDFIVPLLCFFSQRRPLPFYKAGFLARADLVAKESKMVGQRIRRDRFIGVKGDRAAVQRREWRRNVWMSARLPDNVAVRIMGQ